MTMSNFFIWYPILVGNPASSNENSTHNKATRKCCVLLRPGHWATLPTKGHLKWLTGHLVGCVFFAELRVDQNSGWRNRKNIELDQGIWEAQAKPTRKCCVLLRPCEKQSLPTEGILEVADRSLSWLLFLMREFSKNERQDCDHWVWLLE